MHNMAGIALAMRCSRHSTGAACAGGGPRHAAGPSHGPSTPGGRGRKPDPPWDIGPSQIYMRPYRLALVVGVDAEKVPTPSLWGVAQKTTNTCYPGESIWIGYPFAIHSMGYPIGYPGSYPGGGASIIL